MLKNIKGNNRGFTIVETLIVLAIAGLIILIVLLAVPALQRTSRNTNIKSDATAIAGGISEYESNNGGVLPATITNANGVVTVNNAGVAGTLPAQAKVQGSDTIQAGTTVPTTLPQGTLQYNLSQKCGATTANGRAVAVYYPVETSSTTGVGCVDD